MADQRTARLRAAVSVGAVPGAAGMEHTTAGWNLNRHQFDAAADGGGGLAQRTAVVVGRVELPERRGTSPAVRATRVLDRAAGGRGVIECHPAGEEARRYHPTAVAIVLMETERLRAGRLPQHVVLAHARPRPARERRAQSADLLLEHDARNGAVRLPAVTDLPRQVRPVPADAPVPFVGIQAGLELATEQWFEARPRERNLLRAQESIEDQEAVCLESLDLSRSELHHLADVKSLRVDVSPSMSTGWRCRRSIRGSRACWRQSPASSPSVVLSAAG